MAAGEASPYCGQGGSSWQNFDPVEYFKEHVVYELLMLHYCKDQLETISVDTREGRLKSSNSSQIWNI
jgi:hypothetical protein